MSKLPVLLLAAFVSGSVAFCITGLWTDDPRWGFTGAYLVIPVIGALFMLVATWKEPS
jgi:hypothetical protein